MMSVLMELPLSYVVVSEGRRCGSASAVHEPSPVGPPYRASSLAPKSSTSRVRLHLKPGQKGTKQLLAQYGDRLICVRYRYDAQRKKRFKTMELLVAERDWEPPPPRFGHDQIVGLRVAFWRRGSPRPGEAGRRDVESRATALATALRSRGRARPSQPHRRRTRIQS